MWLIIRTSNSTADWGLWIYKLLRLDLATSWAAFHFFAFLGIGMEGSLTEQANKDNKINKKQDSHCGPNVEYHYVSHGLIHCLPHTAILLLSISTYKWFCELARTFLFPVLAFYILIHLTDVNTCKWMAFVDGVFVLMVLNCPPHRGAISKTIVLGTT